MRPKQQDRLRGYEQIAVQYTESSTVMALADRELCRVLPPQPLSVFGGYGIGAAVVLCEQNHTPTQPDASESRLPSPYLCRLRWP